MSNYSRILIHISICIFIFGGCSNNDNNATIETHPIMDRIPYWNYSGQKYLVKKEYSDAEIEDGYVEVFISGEYLLTQKSFTDYFDISAFQHMDIPYMSDHGIIFESLGTNRVSILNTNRQQLIEYQIDDNNWSAIAESGPGPRELSFATDMVVWKDSLYVVSQDARIKIFSCQSTPCEYSRTINLDNNVQPVSLLPSDNGFVVLGSQFSSMSGITTEVETNSLFEFDRSGKLLHTWGELYDTQGHWMLLRPFTQGKVRSTEASNVSISYFDSFPMLYHYDSENDLIKITELSDFELAKQKYWPQTGELQVPEDNMSKIENLTFIDKHNFVLSVVHRRAHNVIDREEDRVSYSKDFYMINTIANSGQFLGSLENVSEGENIYFTDQHILLYKDDKYQIAHFDTSEL